MPTTSRGFTLIETLVALGIVVAMLSGLVALVRLSVVQDSSRFEELALTIASSNLEELRAAGYSALPSSSALSDSRLSMLPSGAGNITVTNGTNDSKNVTVVVTWVGRTGTSRDITLSTIIAENGGLL